MQTRKLLSLTALALGLVLLVGLLWLPTPAAAQTATPANDAIDCLVCDVDLTGYTGPLTEAEIQGLLLALNDEYHAAAVYSQVIEDFGNVRPFTNILRAENSHIAAVTRLLERYGVPVPANAWLGNAPSFDSLTEACQVGVEAEILNRDLYTALFDSTDRVDIERVYSALQRASETKHLPAFQRCAAI